MELADLIMWEAASPVKGSYNGVAMSGNAIMGLCITEPETEGDLDSGSRCTAGPQPRGGADSGVRRLHLRRGSLCERPGAAAQERHPGGCGRGGVP